MKMIAPRRTTPSSTGTIRSRRLAMLTPAHALALCLAAAMMLQACGKRDSPDAGPAPGDADQGAVRTPAPRPTTVVEFAAGCVTAECHAGFTAARTVHQPITEGACDTCHLADSGGHVYPLSVEPDQLCSQCHETGGEAPVQHAAMSAEGCLACHEAHASDSPMLLAAESLRDVCKRCHAPASGSSVHQPYGDGDCAACHEPHASASPGLLRGGAGIEHCGMCHADTVTTMSEANHSHGTVDGECRACHAAHASDTPGLLVAGIGETCVRCHEDVGRTVDEALVTHDAVISGDRCLNCHEPHQAENSMMLRDSQANVCMACHDKPQQAADGREIPAMAAELAESGVVHGPVRSGNCGACHSVHGGNHAKLVRELNPQVLLGAFDVRNYALCFSCHDESLAIEERGAATGFREGDRNLHRVHLTSNERSKSCGSCHAVHAASNPRLIAQHIAYDGSAWIMDMNFEITDDGGRCAPGCHEPLGYNRSGGVPPELPGQGGAP